MRQYWAAIRHDAHEKLYSLYRQIKTNKPKSNDRKTSLQHADERIANGMCAVLFEYERTKKYTRGTRLTAQFIKHLAQISEQY